MKKLNPFCFGCHEKTWNSSFITMGKIVGSQIVRVHRTLMKWVLYRSIEQLNPNELRNLGSLELFRPNYKKLDKKVFVLWAKMWNFAFFVSFWSKIFFWGPVPKLWKKVWAYSYGTMDICAKSEMNRSRGFWVTGQTVKIPWGPMLISDPTMTHLAQFKPNELSIMKGPQRACIRCPNGAYGRDEL